MSKPAYVRRGLKSDWLSRLPKRIFDPTSRPKVSRRCLVISSEDVCLFVDEGPIDQK